MQQYTAYLANQMTGAFDSKPVHGWPATIITNRRVPRDRYAPQVAVLPTVEIAGTGLQKTSFNLRGLKAVYHAIRATQPDIVHFTGPHLWNTVLLSRLKRAGIRTIHTIHDLDPHSGTSYGRLLHVWNNLILRRADHILVHGQIYRERLVQNGLLESRVSYTPLLHLFLSYATEATLRQTRPTVTLDPFVLFFARIEAYKGVDTLCEAMGQLNGHSNIRAIVAGKGELGLAVPDNVEIRNRLLGDAEAIDLFSRCSLVVLPYRDATQSALIGAAYFFGKPVIVTRTGALPEYVDDGVTGWVVEPGNAAALAERLTIVATDSLLLRQMGRAGQTWYEAHYQVERTTLRHMYERVTDA